MSSFTLVVLIFIAGYGFCNGFNLGILMDRLDNVESRIENNNKIRRKEIAAVYEKLSVIDSLKAKVNILMDIVVGTEPKPNNIFKKSEDVKEASYKNSENRDLRNVLFEAFRKVKMRNEKLHKDYKKLKVEVMTTLANQFLNQSNTIDSMIEDVKVDMKRINLTVTDVKSITENVENQVNINTELGQELVTRMLNVEENITLLQKDFAAVSQLQNKVDTVSETTQDLRRNLDFKPESCADRQKLDNTSGVYDLWSSSLQSKSRVYCDQETDGGGWIVFQRREDGSVDFDRNWNDYKLGFGDLNGEFWLGNEHVSRLTSNGTHELRIDMEDFDGNIAYAKYSDFKILPGSEKYRLQVSGYSGNAGDSLAYHNDKPFSAQDNWNLETEYCKKYKAGWWFHNCMHSNLNGEYYQRNPPSTYLGVVWRHWLGWDETIKSTEMKFRSIMYSFSLKVIVFLTVNGFCHGLESKILKDRLDNMEKRIETHNKIRRQEMTAVFEKLSVIDSLEAKVKIIMDIVVGTQTYPGAENQEKEKIHDTRDPNEDIRYFRNVIFDAFRREKTRNRMFQKDYKKFKIELMTTLNNHTLNHSNTLNNMIDKVNSDINNMNFTAIDIASKMANREIQGNESTDCEQELVSRIVHVEENITSLHDDVNAKVKQLQYKVDAVSEKQDLHWNISFKPESCAMRKQLGHSSGVFDIWFQNHESKISVYCDQETDDGGWIVFQRRKDGSVDFDRNWKDYKQGFGSPNEEFWLGNEYVSRLTSEGTHELRIDMEDFDGNKVYAKYSNFKIHPEKDKYRLMVSGYTGDAGDGLKFHNRKWFSTKDMWYFNQFCKSYNSGWWFGLCATANLNGVYYYRHPPKIYLGVSWQPWLGYNATLKFTEMKFRKSNEK
ncbi:uncharacterized protein LOC123534930 [Mercenaria mercenaria]|uniref:uncharacterized protein LOC123534930 n=1 Tax=Mercenaria mercenaria TaxID=6596 RepID=UPI00234FA0C5|nr:uncharacterized protein LOC123534930 [Mercenaria mercenaria]